MRTHPTDSFGVDACVELASSYFGENLDSSLAIGERGLATAKILQNDELIAACHNTMGIARLYQGNNRAAIPHFEQVVTIRERSGDAALVAGATNNLAIAHQGSGNYALALDFHIRSLELKEELGDTARLRVSYNNIGLIYENLEDYPTARRYYTRALALRPLSLDSVSYLTNLFNIGGTYFEEFKDDSARIYFNRGMPIAEVLGDRRMLGLHYLNFGAMEQRAGHYSAAEKQVSMALALFEELGKQDQIAAAKARLGVNYLKTGDPEKARTYCDAAYIIAKETESLDKQADCLACLHESNAALGNSRAAYEYLLKAQELQDSLSLNVIHKQIVRRDLDHDYRKKILADSLEAARTNSLVKLSYENKIKGQRTAAIFLIVVGGLLLGLAVLLFYFLRQKRRHNRILEEKVKVRTQELKSQNDQLGEYAFMNAHLLRQPLSQIMGLIPLIQQADDSLEREEYIRLLLMSAQKLDRVVHAIRDVVEPGWTAGKPDEKFYN